MNKIRWYNRVRIQIIAVLFLIIIIPIVIFWNYNQWLTRRNMLRQYSDSAISSLNSTSLVMLNTMKTILDYSLQISNDEEFLDMVQAFQHQYANQEDTEYSRACISLALNSYVSNQPLLESMYIYFTDSHHLVTMIPGHKLLLESDAYCQQIQNLYYNQLQSSIEWKLLNRFSDQEESTLSLIRFIPSTNTRKTCVLICNLKNQSWIRELSQTTTSGSSLYITDYQGNPLIQYVDSQVSNDQSPLSPALQQAIHSMEESGSYPWNEDFDKERILYYNSLESGWKYILSIPESQILQGTTTWNGWFYLLLLISGFLSIFLGSMVLNQAVLAPIQRIIEFMGKTENGTLEEATGSVPANEIGLLFGSYNHMIRRLRELIDEVYIQQLQKEQTQLNYLQSQMDEHFLFNTLNTIYSEACHENAPATGRMILTLSKYFRRSLSYGQEMLPLNEIAELLVLYLQLQRMRYGQNLQCKVDTFPEMNQYVALKYLFQPIVENAIVHGFEKNLEGHKIHITFRREAEELYFEVEDDGTGIPEEKLAELTAQIHDSHQTNHQHGYALRNIYQQICLNYGDRPIHIESEYGYGTRVYFRIPLQTSDKTPSDSISPIS